MKNLNKLKDEHARLINLNNTKNEMICIDFHSFATMLTGSVDVRDLSEPEACEVYQRRINSLNAKFDVSDHILCAIKDADDKMIKALDYFNEAGLKPKNERQTNIKN